MSTNPSSFSNGNIGGLGYGIGITIGILFILTTIALASYYCTRNQITISPLQTNHPQDPHDSQQHSMEIGLDDATLSRYPVLLYSEAKLKHKDSSCSICLMDYKASDETRMLPDCSHVFHVQCVDPWLRMHPTCPVCRTTPIPTPVSTPLAEVAPLASPPQA